MSKNKTNKKIVKIVYFDEGSALDYLDIINNGHLYEELQESTTKESTATIGSGATIGTKLKLFSFFKTSATIKADAEINKIGDKIWKTSLTNTILTDFLETSKQDKCVTVFENKYITTYKNSIAQFKSLTPYLMLIKDSQIEGINLSVFDSVLEKAKGYYELVLTDKEQSKILRFNITAFKNNYYLADLTKMSLTYFCIKVGESNLSKLDMKNEFNVDNLTEEVSAKSILGKQENTDPLVEIYDVILAGVLSDEN